MPSRRDMHRNSSGGGYRSGGRGPRYRGGRGSRYDPPDYNGYHHHHNYYRGGRISVIGGIIILAFVGFVFFKTVCAGG